MRRAIALVARASRSQASCAERTVDEDRAPGPLGDQRRRHLLVGNHAGARAPAPEPPRHQRGLGCGRRDDQHVHAGKVGRRECRHRPRRPRAAAAPRRGRSSPRPACCRRRCGRPCARRCAWRWRGRARCRRTCAPAPVSACSNSRKMRACSCGAMPMPLSRTRKRISSGARAGLDDQRDAAALGELDGVAGEIEQHLPQPRRVADHVAGQAVLHIGRDLELLAPAPAAR